MMMTEEEKLEFYKSEIKGAAFVEHLGFRCPKRLQVFLDSKAMVEGRDISSVIRRLLTKAAEEEGYDRNG